MTTASDALPCQPSADANQDSSCCLNGDLMHLCIIILCPAQYQQSVQWKLLLSRSALLHVEGPLAWAYTKNILTTTDLRLQLFLCVCVLYHKVNSIKWDKDSCKGESISSSVHEYIRRLSLQCKKYWLFSWLKNKTNPADKTVTKNPTDEHFDILSAAVLIKLGIEILTVSTYNIWRY